MRKTIKVATVPFLICFLAWAGILMVKEGFAVDAQGTVYMEKFKYLHNLLQMPAVLAMLLVGVVLVLAGIWIGGFTSSRKGIWASGAGTILTVMSVFFLAGFNGTAYYPSIADLQSSLTITNSCSSQYTLLVMSCVSLLIPFVLAYIIYAWRAMDKKMITETEMKGTEEKY